MKNTARDDQGTHLAQLKKSAVLSSSSSRKKQQTRNRTTKHAPKQRNKKCTRITNETEKQLLNALAQQQQQLEQYEKQLMEQQKLLQQLQQHITESRPIGAVPSRDIQQDVLRTCHHQQHDIVPVPVNAFGIPEALGMNRLEILINIT